MLEEKHRKKEIISLTREDLLDYWVPLDRISTVHFQVVDNISLALNEKWTEWWFYKYSESRWVEFYMSLSWLKWDKSFKFALKESWHEYIDWEFYKDWELIPQFLESWEINPKYIEALDNINFYSDLQVYFWALKALRSWKKPDFSVESFYRWIVSWVVRIKELMEYKWDGKITHSLIPDKDFPKLLIRAIQELPSQCLDTRFYENAKWERMWMEVTKQELDEYLKPTEWEPIITQKMYDECIELINKRDELIQKRKETVEQSKTGLKIEKEKKWVLDKIMSILD